MDVECGICFDTMLPCQALSQSECHPVSHFFHLDCHNRWLQTQSVTEPPRCISCRQFQIGESDWYDFADIFNFPSDELTTVADLSRYAQRYIRAWQCGAVSEAEKQGAVDAARLSRVEM